MTIRVKKLHKDAVLPKRAHATDAGLDLTAVNKEYLPDGRVKYDTGLAIRIPPGHVGLLCPRSSIIKTCLTLSNSLGVLDETYNGNVMAFFNVDVELSRVKGDYNIGDRICQLVIVPCVQQDAIEVDELDETERGTGGFGSTNN